MSRMRTGGRHVLVDPATRRHEADGRRPWLAKWMALLHAIGNVQAWILLSLAYVVLILPIGLLFRVFNDPLRIRRRPSSNWQPFTRQFDRLDQAQEQS